ncbi:MAG: hypothetical protein MRY64_13285 [Hyphomonadaceae bacterium]|nr:hypothetical protein [Hyphomonadaceae bacterium]
MEIKLHANATTTPKVRAYIQASQTSVAAAFERFNRRLSEVLRSHPGNGGNARRNRFDTHQQRNDFIPTLVDNYNRTRLKCLNDNAGDGHLPSQVSAAILVESRWPSLPFVFA